MTPTRPLPARPRPPGPGRATPAALLAMGLLAGCTFGGPAKPRTDAQRATAACKVDADRAYLQQNRVLLSERSQRDTPFSSSGMVGVTSSGLPQLYGRSADFEACLRSHSVEGAAAEPAVSGASAPQMDPSYQP
ncbi:MAG: hypothetical protein ACRYGC_17195 [Janthinobacterium lividum]